MRLPVGVDYSKGDMLLALLDKNEPIGQKRTDYLHVRRQFQNGAPGGDQLPVVAQQYQDELNRYLARYSESQKRPEEVSKHVASFGVSAATVAIGLAFTGVAPAILLGGVAYVTADFVFPALVEKYHVDRAFKWVGRKARSRIPEWQDVIISTGTMTALPIDHDAATRIIGELPTFH